MGDQVYKELNEIGHCSIRSPPTARTSHLQDLENFPYNSRVGTCKLGDLRLSTVQVLYPFTVERTVEPILYMSMIFLEHYLLTSLCLFFSVYMNSVAKSIATYIFAFV